MFTFSLSPTLTVVIRFFSLTYNTLKVAKPLTCSGMFHPAWFVHAFLWCVCSTNKLHLYFVKSYGDTALTQSHVCINRTHVTRSGLPDSNNNVRASRQCSHSGTLSNTSALAFSLKTNGNKSTLSLETIIQSLSATREKMSSARIVSGPVWAWQDVFSSQVPGWLFVFDLSWVWSVTS